MYKEQCIPFNADGSAQAPVHLVIGHAGAGLCFNTLPQRPVFWHKVSITHGYMRVEANGMDLHCEVTALCKSPCLHVIHQYDQCCPAASLHLQCQITH